MNTNAHDILILVPATLHYREFPRLVLQRLAGKPLLLRMLEMARGAVPSVEQIAVVTDDDEVKLLADRNGYPALLRTGLLDADGSLNAAELHEAVVAIETARDEGFSAVMVLRPYSPFIKARDLTDGIAELRDGEFDTVVSATPERRHSWRREDGHYSLDFGDYSLEDGASSLFRETGAFLVSRRGAVAGSRFVGAEIGLSVIPPERALEIHSRHEWWICNRLLSRKRVVFVLVGHASVGLGHFYRTTQLAHEIINHDVHFVCTRESDLAAQLLRDQPFPFHIQHDDSLDETVVALEPDLVVNDILNTDRHYVERLKQSGATVVNFEDLGTGSAVADLVINAIFRERVDQPNRIGGPDYFCLRDEFLHASPGPFRQRLEEVLITFGGTDSPNNSLRVLRTLLPEAAARGVRISLVTGPGFAHGDSITTFLDERRPEHVEWAHNTKRISEYMARADLAFSSAGRTVFELAAMRVPGIIMAANEREETHSFASTHLGMLYLGRHDEVSDEEIVDAFTALADSNAVRRHVRLETEEWDFAEGKNRVLAHLRRYLDE